MATLNRDGVSSPLCDAHSRIVRALEALRDGDRESAEQVLDDLTADLWRVIEAEERAA
jgi:hypothetical protein